MSRGFFVQLYKGRTTDAWSRLETLMGLASLGWVVVRMIYRRIPEAVSMRLKKGRDVAGRGADQVARKTRQVRSRV